MTNPLQRELSDLERAILRMAIEKMTVGREQALAQLSVARHGRPAHPGTHPCFFIDLPDGVEAIPQGAESPLILAVAPDQHNVGSIELFIVNGRLDSLDWSEVSLTNDAPDVTEFPAIDRISPEAAQWAVTMSAPRPKRRLVDELWQAGTLITVVASFFAVGITARVFVWGLEPSLALGSGLVAVVAIALTVWSGVVGFRRLRDPQHHAVAKRVLMMAGLIAVLMILPALTIAFFGDPA